MKKRRGCLIRSLKLFVIIQLTTLRTPHIDVLVFCPPLARNGRLRIGGGLTTLRAYWALRSSCLSPPFRRASW